MIVEFLAQLIEQIVYGKNRFFRLDHARFDLVDVEQGVEHA